MNEAMINHEINFAHNILLLAENDYKDIFNNLEMAFDSFEDLSDD